MKNKHKKAKTEENEDFPGCEKIKFQVGTLTGAEASISLVPLLHLRNQSHRLFK
ncbi:unnamed protein product [Camellia sinensis]